MIRLIVTALLTVALALPAQARGVIRDAEIEYALRQVAQPILQAAGLPNSTRIIIINDDSLNAFVADSRTIFLHSGLIMRLDNAAQIQAVIAHEAAHIANGHLTRRPAAARNAGNIAKLGLVLAGVAAAAGNARAGAGVAIGSTSSAMRNFFAHTRAEEASADQSALRYLAQAGVDPNAMAEVLELFAGQEVLTVGRQDPYIRSHPLSRDRLRAVQGYAAAVTPRQTDRRAVEYWYARSVGKLSAFLRAPSWTLRRVRGQQGEIATLRRAVAHHREPNLSRALQNIDSLIAMRPNDPYYHELKGQFLLEGGQAAAAVASYQRATQLARRQPLIEAGLGRALMAAGRYSDALPVLERARARDGFNPSLLRDLATAHGRLGQPGLASVAAAERYASLGRMDDARINAERASGLLPRGSSGWLRAQDVLSAVPDR
ncbi:MAG: M48 family metalloprotease [Pseudomonadota bacterium]